MVLCHGLEAEAQGEQGPGGSQARPEVVGVDLPFPFRATQAGDGALAGQPGCLLDSPWTLALEVHGGGCSGCGQEGILIPS